MFEKTFITKSLRMFVKKNMERELLNHIQPLKDVTAAIIATPTPSLWGKFQRTSELSKP